MLPSTLLEGARDTRVACADIVDRGQIRMTVEQSAGLGIGFLAVIENFAQFNHFQLGKLLGQYVAKPHLTLLVAAIGARTGKHRRLADRASTHEATDKITGEPPRGPVVDADIGN